jgi:hypothetical protein
LCMAATTPWNGCHVDVCVVCIPWLSYRPSGGSSLLHACVTIRCDNAATLLAGPCARAQALLDETCMIVECCDPCMRGVSLSTHACTLHACALLSVSAFRHACMRDVLHHCDGCTSSIMPSIVYADSPDAVHLNRNNALNLSRGHCLCLSMQCVFEHKCMQTCRVRLR